MTLNAYNGRLTSLSHGGGCGCKIAPGVLSDILRASPLKMIPPALLAGSENNEDAAVYQINDHQAIVATTDFFMPIVDDPYDFVTDFVSGQDRIRIAADQLEGAVAGAAVTVSAGALVGTAAQFLTFSVAGIGYLAWDPDGTGALDATVIALFLNGAAPVATDITLF